MGRGASTASNLLVMAIAAAHLSTEQFGLWATVFSLSTLNTFLDFGVGAAVVNVAATNRGPRAFRGAQVMLSAVAFLAIVGVLAFAILLALMQWPIPLSSMPIAPQDQETRLGILLFFGLLFLLLPLSLIQKFQLGLEEADQVGLWQIVGAVAAAAAMWAITRGTESIAWLLPGALIGLVISHSLNWLASMRKHSVTLAGIDVRTLVEDVVLIVRHGWRFGVLQLLAFIGSNSDTVIVAHFFGMEEAASFAATARLFGAVFVAQFLFAPLWAAFSSAIAAGEIKWARRALLQATYSSLAVTLFIAIAFLFFARPVIKWWLGLGIVPAWPLVYGFSAWMLVSAYYGPLMALFSTPKMVPMQLKAMSICVTLAVVAKIALGILMGPAGIVWGAVIAYGIVGWPLSAVAARELRS